MKRLTRKALRRQSKLSEEELIFIAKSIGTDINVLGIDLSLFEFSELNYYQIKETYYSDINNFIVNDFINAVLKVKGLSKFNIWLFKQRLSGAQVIAIAFWAFSCYDAIGKIEVAKLKAVTIKGDVTIDYSELDVLGAFPAILLIAEKYADIDSALKFTYNRVFQILYNENILRNKSIERQEKLKKKNEASR